MSAIRDIRKRLGLTQAELADLLGLTQPTVSRMENVDEVDPRTLLALDGLLYRQRGAEGRGAHDAAVTGGRYLSETGNGAEFSARLAGTGV
jgi:transcriptional regulator with XRE-family HTH domain